MATTKTKDEYKPALCGTSSEVLKRAWKEVSGTPAGYKPVMKNPHKNLDPKLVAFYRKKG